MVYNIGHHLLLWLRLRLPIGLLILPITLSLTCVYISVSRLRYAFNMVFVLYVVNGFLKNPFTDRLI
jgi:hypothetical protein